MDKRLSLTLLLSAVILVGWLFTPWGRPRPAKPPAATAASQPAQAGASSADSAPATAAKPAAPAAPSFQPIDDVIADGSERSEVLMFGQPGERGYYRAEFSNRGARLTDLRIGNYFREARLSEEARQDPDHWTRLALPSVGEGANLVQGGSLLLSTSASSQALAPTPLEDALWTMQVQRDDAGRANGVVFRYAPGTGVIFEKRVMRVPGSWELALELSVENRKAGAGGGRMFALTPVGWMPEELGDKFYLEPRAVAVGGELGKPATLAEIAPDLRKTESGGLAVPRPIQFAGVHNKYFACLLRPDGVAAERSLAAARYERATVPPAAGSDHGHQYLRAVVDLDLTLPDEARRESWSYRLYAGPKQREILDDKAHPELLPFVVLLDHDLGWSWIAGIARLLTFVLQGFHWLTGNWGVAIILLTLFVRLALFPMNRRSQTSMARYGKKMKRIQPRLDELKKRLEKDPAKLRTEQAKIMQEEGAFPPLGGCLPIFLQMPVFFGLFAALRATFDLRHAPFALWMHDLSRPDAMFDIDLHIPLLFTSAHLKHFNLLPILMVALWIVQQLTAPKPTDEQAQKMQRMMMFMPVLMGFFLYDYAAGLSLYMITSSGLAIFEQTVIKKIWPLDDREPDKKKAGCGPFSGTMKKLMDEHQRQVKSLQNKSSKKK